MSSAAGGSGCHVLRRGRSLNPFTHAAQASSFQNKAPVIIGARASWSMPQTRHHVPTRSWSSRPQLSPSCRRIRRSSLNAESHCPWSHTAARGRHAFARHASTSRPRFQRFIALSPCPRHRSSALLVWAERTAGASVVQTNTQPATKRRAADGVPFFCPCRHVCRARLACSAGKREACPPPRPSCWPPAAQSGTASVRSVAVCWRFQVTHSSQGAPAASRRPPLKG
jgi:hypothetical protein